MNKSTFYEKIINNDRVKKYLPFVILMLSTLFILRYIIFLSVSYTTYDTLDTLLWANATYESGKLFDSDFYYACLLPFGGQLLMLPFVYIFGLSYKAHLIGMCLFALLFTFSMWFMVSSMGYSKIKAAIFVFIIHLITLLSFKFREIFWDHIIYYSLGLFFYYTGFGIIFKILKNNSKKAYILLGIWTLLCSTNGMQALLIYVFPIMGSALLYIITNNEEALLCKKHKALLYVFSVMAISALMGLFTSKILCRGVSQNYADIYGKFCYDFEWINNLKLLFMNYFRVFGVLDMEDEFLSLNGIINFVTIVFSLSIIIIPVIALFNYKLIKKTEVRLVLISYFVFCFLFIFVWVFGKISSAGWRLIPVIFMALSTSILVLYEFMNTKHVRVAAMFFAIILCAGYISYIRSASVNIKIENDKNVFFDIVEYLEKNNYTYGYSNLDYATPITVFSENKVKVRAISIKDNEFVPYCYQSNKNWYNTGNDENEKYFIFLFFNKYNDFDWSRYDIGDVHYLGGFVIVDLNKNIEMDMSKGFSY